MLLSTSNLHSKLKKKKKDFLLHCILLHSLIKNQKVNIVVLFQLY